MLNPHKHTIFEHLALIDLLSYHMFRSYRLMTAISKKTQVHKRKSMLLEKACCRKGNN